MSMKLRLLSRSYCSLCQKMLDALAPWQQAHGFSVEVIDIDLVPRLVERYDEKVPVLLLGEEEICHWRLDEKRLAAVLQSAGADDKAMR